jgi:hypothetical protein
VGVRTSAVLRLLGLVTAGCSGSGATPGDTDAGPEPGCDLVPAARVVGLLGTDLVTTQRGSLRTLHERHTPTSCRTVVRGHPERSVTVTAEYHPEPYRLPRKACSEGWVYAGTAEKYTPACQETVDGHGRTTLVVRWQPYLMHVTVDRSDRDWGGDPERALSLSRLVAQRLGVTEAAGDG